MKKLISAAIISGLCVTAQAEVGTFAGITYLFGEKGEFGLTVKALSNRKEDKAIGAIGVNFYPFSKDQKLGFDIGAGYNGRDSALILGYDLLNRNPTISGGWSYTKERTTTTASGGGFGCGIC